MVFERLMSVALERFPEQLQNSSSMTCLSKGTAITSMISICGHSLGAQDSAEGSTFNPYSNPAKCLYYSQFLGKTVGVQRG